MRIDPRFAGQVTPGSPRLATAAGRPTFRLAAERAGGTTRAASAAPLATLDAILMLQGQDDSRERRHRSARRGQDLLEALDGLKAALLSGTTAPTDLRRLADRLSRAVGSSGDPGLDDVIAAIELRAEVELAKLGASTLA